MTLPVTAFTAAICALLILITAIMTVRERFKANAAFGMDESNEALVKAVRSHGNLIEHAPMFVIMIALLELSNAYHLGLMILAAIFLGARVSHILGLHTAHQPGKPPLFRSLGVIGTWVCYAAAIGWIAYMIVLGNL